MPQSESTNAKRKQQESAELFRKFQPRYRAIQLRPLGFNRMNESSKFDFQPESDTWFQWLGDSFIDLTEAHLSFSFTFDPDKSNPRLQMTYAAWNTILAEPFKDRTFYADPKEEDIDRAFRAYSEGRAGIIDMTFSYSGDPIPGVHLIDTMKAHWDFFVPRNSPEGQAIVAAIELEQARRAESTRKKTSAASPSIGAFSARLRDALAAVPV